MGNVGKEGRVEFEFLVVTKAESARKVKAKVGQSTPSF